jgi:hypothetical protein
LQTLWPAKYSKNTVFYDIIGNKEQLKNVLQFIPKGAEVIIEGVVEKPQKIIRL